MGVSCYRGVVIDDKVYIIMPHKATNTYYFLIDQYNRNEIPLYVITGIEVGEGSDEEPVLLDVKIERQIRNWVF